MRIGCPHAAASWRATLGVRPAPRQTMNYETQRHALILRVADGLYAVPTERVRQIVHMAALVSTPGQPSILAGFLNLSGKAIPVIHLRRLFELQAREPQIYTPLVIIESNGMTMALAADAVEEVLDFEPGSLQKLTEGSSLNNCGDALLTAGGREIVLLSCDSLLLTREKECLAELQAVADRRLSELGPLAE